MWKIHGSTLMGKDYQLLNGRPKEEQKLSILTNVDYSFNILKKKVIQLPSLRILSK